MPGLCTAVALVSMANASFAGAEVSVSCTLAHTSSSFVLVISIFLASVLKAEKVEVTHVRQKYFEIFFVFIRKLE